MYLNNNILSLVFYRVKKAAIIALAGHGFFFCNDGCHHHSMKQQRKRHCFVSGLDIRVFHIPGVIG
jgi:hypothetical protein